jgi:hypothetical protein
VSAKTPAISAQIRNIPRKSYGYFADVCGQRRARVLKQSAVAE